MKINLTAAQLIKFGSHIGSPVVDYTNIPYISGIRNKVSYIDSSEILMSLRKIFFLHKKISSKREFTVSDNNFLYNLKLLKNYRSGIVSNREIRRFYYLKKYGKISSNNFFKSKPRAFVKSKQSLKRFPSLLILKKLDRSIISEFKNKNILTSCLIDTKDFGYADYNILFNNKSIISLSYFNKIIR